MPFVSESQRRYLYSQKPSVAKEFAKKTPKGKKLPPRVKIKAGYRRSSDGQIKKY